MGLSICYELSLPKEVAVAEARDLLARLRDEAKALPFEGISELVCLDASDLTAPWPTEGLAFKRLEDVVDVFGRTSREYLYRERLGIADEEYTQVDVPSDLPTTLLGFAVAPGSRCEPASFALAKLTDQSESRWYSWCCCKTQYASALGDDHFLRCHTSVILLLDAAQRLGFECDVRDEAGYFESRDTAQLLQRVGDMNRIVARFAGAFSDAFERAGGDSREVQGEIFRHPDFERLETRE